MKTENKSVKIPLNSYMQLEEIRLRLIQRRLFFNKGELLSFAVSFLQKHLNGEVKRNED